MNESPIPIVQSAPSPADEMLRDWLPKHKAAAENVLEARQTTRTVAWITNYALQRISHQRLIGAACNTIRENVEAIESGVFTEEQEKAIKDAVKEMHEERIRFAAWELRSFGHFKTSCENLTGLVRSIRREAQRREEESPLTSKGLAHEVCEKTRSLLVAKWDNDNGTIEVFGGLANLASFEGLAEGGVA